MKKQLLAFALIILSLTAATAQTAPDFTANDCSGVSHNLYSELDSGKVIVLNWVEPCGACIAASLTAYNIVEGFLTTNPGRVRYYLIDDLGNTNCSSLASWANTNSIGPADRTTFSTAAIVENNYGGVGMPHIAVVGGSSHTYFFNQLNTAANNPAAIASAIVQALTVGINENTGTSFGASVYPNPSTDKIKINYTLTEAGTVSFDVLNVIGKTIVTYPLSKQAAGKHDFGIDVKNLSEGIYLLRFNAGQRSQIIRFAVSH